MKEVIPAMVLTGALLSGAGNESDAQSFPDRYPPRYDKQLQFKSAVLPDNYSTSIESYVVIENDLQINSDHHFRYHTGKLPFWGEMGFATSRYDTRIPLTSLGFKGNYKGKVYGLLSMDFYEEIFLGPKVIVTGLANDYVIDLYAAVKRGLQLVDEKTLVPTERDFEATLNFGKMIDTDVGKFKDFIVGGSATYRKGKIGDCYLKVQFVRDYPLGDIIFEAGVGTNVGNAAGNKIYLSAKHNLTERRPPCQKTKRTRRREKHR